MHIYDSTHSYPPHISAHIRWHPLTFTPTSTFTSISTDLPHIYSTSTFTFTFTSDHFQYRLHNINSSSAASSSAIGMYPVQGSSTRNSPMRLYQYPSISSHYIYRLLTAHSLIVSWHFTHICLYIVTCISPHIYSHHGLACYFAFC